MAGHPQPRPRRNGPHPLVEIQQAMIVFPDDIDSGFRHAVQYNIIIFDLQNRFLPTPCGRQALSAVLRAVRLALRHIKNKSLIRKAFLQGFSRMGAIENGCKAPSHAPRLAESCVSDIKAASQLLSYMIMNNCRIVKQKSEIRCLCENNCLHRTNVLL